MLTLSRLSLAVVATLGATGSLAVAQDAVVHRFGDWTVTIQPARTGGDSFVPPAPASRFRLASYQQPPAPAAPEGDNSGENAKAPGDAALAAGLAKVHQYSQVYNSIPFSRAEYNATPSYRHDATMEFLFGQLRQTVIQRGTTHIRYQNQGMTYPQMGFPWSYSPYGFNAYYYPFYTGYYRPFSLW